MIYTLTTNPSIDYYLYQKNEMIQGINRIEDYEFIAAGKGVNVSRVLNTFGVKNRCVLFVGGFSGSYIVEQINKLEHVEAIPVWIEEASRINVKTRLGGKEIDFNTSGPEVSQCKTEELISVFEAVKKNDIVCINGSLQKGMKDTVVKIAEKVRNNGGYLILDVPNLTLDDILRCKPSLIKPNEEELEKLLQGQSIDVLLKNDIAILLSLGEKGSQYIFKNGKFSVGALQVDVLNTVGAGDSLLAGFIYGWQLHYTLEQTLAFATATAAYKISHKNDVNLQKIKEMAMTVSVEKKA